MKEKNEVDKTTNYDKYEMSKGECRNYFICAGGALFLIGYIFYLNLFVSICMIFLTIPLKRIYIEIKIKKRKELLREQFKDLLYSLSASISAGRQMSEALLEGKINLSLMYGEDTPIMMELSHMSKCIQESRVTDEMLLKDFAHRSSIEDIVNFADVYTACRTTGADVSSVISKASEVLTDKMTIEREIKAITIQKKAEAKIISSMPVIVVLFLNIVSPGYLGCLYNTLAGRLVMTVALAVIAISYYIMNKMMEVSV